MLEGRETGLRKAKPWAAHFGRWLGRAWRDCGSSSFPEAGGGLSQRVHWIPVAWNLLVQTRRQRPLETVTKLGCLSPESGGNGEGLKSVRRWVAANRERPRSPHLLGTRLASKAHRKRPSLITKDQHQGFSNLAAHWNHLRNIKDS